MWKTKTREGIPGLFLLANSLSWFSLTMLTIGDIAQGRSLVEILMIAGTYFGGLISSAAIGSVIPNRILRNKVFLLIWVILGTTSCLLFSLWTANDAPNIALKSLFLGISVGIGIPACFAFFGSLTKTENRGKIAAVIFFIIQLFTASILLISDLSNLEQHFQTLSVWRLIGILGVIFFGPIVAKTEELKTSFRSILKERTFILYFLPWFLFTLVNFIEAPIIETYFEELYSTSVIFTAIISSLSAIFIGILCDRKGRKIASMTGFVLLGLSYAILSFFSVGSTKPMAQYLYILCDGVAWGALFVSFIFVIWGDISEGKRREKYYFVGSIPFLLSGLIQILVQPFVEAIDVTASFSLASFFLFLAIVPLLFATETLPEKAMKDRDLKSYIEKAQKIVTNKKIEIQEPKKDENTKEYEEAKKLAEKYY